MTLMNTGDVSRRLGFPITNELLSKIGIEPTKAERKAKFYSEEQWPEICEALAHYCEKRIKVRLTDLPEAKPRSKPKAEKPAPPPPAAAPRDFDEDEDDEL